jgi:hypothetical protein
VRERRGNRGNAPAEFVLVQAVLVATVLGLIQLSAVIHVRHTLISAAQEGARWASYYDTEASEGVNLTRELVTTALSADYARSVAVLPHSVAGVPGVRMVVEAPIPTIGLWSAGGTLRVWADAPLERPLN